MGRGATAALRRSYDPGELVVVVVRVFVCVGGGEVALRIAHREIGKECGLLLCCCCVVICCFSFCFCSACALELDGELRVRVREGTREGEGLGMGLG